RMQHGSLQSGKRELETLGDHGTREVEAARVAFLREALDRRATRILEPEQRRDLVERLTGCVIARFAEQAVAAPGGDIEQQRMTTGDQQRHERRREVTV